MRKSISNKGKKANVGRLINYLPTCTQSLEIFKWLVLTVFGVLFGRFPPSSPVNACRFWFTAPCTYRIFIETVRAFKQVVVILVLLLVMLLPWGQYVVIDDGMTTSDTDAAGTSIQYRERQFWWVMLAYYGRLYWQQV